MINVKKGTAHSLLQSDKVGKIATGQTGIVAGMIVQFNSTAGEVVKGVVEATNGAIGFANRSQTDSDVLESRKIGAYMLDGQSIIETDQYVGDIGLYLVGTPVYASKESDEFGKITTVSADGVLIGYVDEVRELPNTNMDTDGTYTNWLKKTSLVGVKLA